MIGNLDSPNHRTGLPPPSTLPLTPEQKANYTAILNSLNIDTWTDDIHIKRKRNSTFFMHTFIKALSKITPETWITVAAHISSLELKTTDLQRIYLNISAISKMLNHININEGEKDFLEEIKKKFHDRIDILSQTIQALPELQNQDSTPITSNRLPDQANSTHAKPTSLIKTKPPPIQIR